MNVVRIENGDARYPDALNVYLGDKAPDSVAAIGNLDILRHNTLALFCSVKCPGKLILETYDLAQRLRESDLAVIGGFHSPMERECLAVLLRGPAPVIVCPARSIEGMRLPGDYRRPLAEGRLLILSPFGERDRRAKVETALYRNRFVAALAGRVFVAYAEPLGKTERFCGEILAWGKPLYTLQDEANADLIGLGAQPVRAHGITAWE